MQYVEKTLTGIIESGQSSITFTDDFITDNSIIDVFFSDDDINPTEQTQTGNRVIIDILPLDHNISIAVRVTNADVIDYNSEIESINDTLTSHSGVLSSHGSEIINLRHDVTDIETEQALIVQDISDLSTNKQDNLTAGENITIENNIISAIGGTNIILDDVERVVGEYFGKPLYMKSSNNPTYVPKTSWTNILTLPSDCMIQHIFGLVFTTNASEELPLQYFRTTSKFICTAIQSDHRRVEIYLGDNTGNGTMRYITALYTKSTD